MIYMADLDHERGENVCVLMPINFFGNTRNIVKGLINIVVKLVKVFGIKKGIYTQKGPCGLFFT